MNYYLHYGDCLEVMATMADNSVHCCVTSPPYWGLRDYGHDGQIGLEATPEQYVARIVEVFREVRRVLRDDGTLWLNLGDSYASSGTNSPPSDKSGLNGGKGCGTYEKVMNGLGRAPTPPGLKPKDLVGIPWRVAFALQADGWWLRQDIIWHKPNPMPESVRDRCTKAHEYVFLLTKSERYFYDAESVSEAASGESSGNRRHKYTDAYNISDSEEHRTKAGLLALTGTKWTTRNRRSVWTISTRPYSGAHFAVMPPDLVKPCILAGCPEGGTVLDPFAGSGTVLAVAVENDRNGIGIELNPDYVELANQRVSKAFEDAMDAKAQLSLF
jgi:site-specific DNA-methyltransferase (adenine-specific)